MTRGELKRAIKAAVPSVVFDEVDGLGTKTSRHYIECCLPVSDVPALEAFAESVGRKAQAIGVGCYPSAIPMCIRSIAVEVTQ